MDKRIYPIENEIDKGKHVGRSVAVVVVTLVEIGCLSEYQDASSDHPTVNENDIKGIPYLKVFN